MIVSKDSDFRQLAFLNGPPPKPAWLRMGDVDPVGRFDQFGSDLFRGLLAEYAGHHPDPLRQRNSAPQSGSGPMAYAVRI